MSPAALGPLSLALLMPLPRINVSFPRKGERDGEPADQPKIVDWTGRRLTFFHQHKLLPRISIVFPASDDPGEAEGDDISLLSDDEILRKMMLDERTEGEPEGIEPLPEKTLVPASESVSSLEDAIRKAMEEEGQGLESEVGAEITPPSEPDPPEGTISSLDEAIDKAMMEQDAEPLDVAKGIVDAGGKRSVALPTGVAVAEEAAMEDEAGSEGIFQGSMVLVEGAKGQQTRAVTQNMSYGLLENGHTVTYITTGLTIQDFIVEMHDHNYRIAQYLPDQSILVIPVYPFIEGKGDPKALLDKLITSTQLQTTDTIFVDSLSDFLGGSFDEVICMRLLEYLRRLSGMGKTIFLVVDDGQKGILSLRLASDLHFALSSQGGKGVQVKRYHPIKAGAKEILHFRVDPVLGLISQPRKGSK